MTVFAAAVTRPGGGLGAGSRLCGVFSGEWSVLPGGLLQSISCGATEGTRAATAERIAAATTVRDHHGYRGPRQRNRGSIEGLRTAAKSPTGNHRIWRGEGEPRPETHLY